MLRAACVLELLSVHFFDMSQLYTLSKKADGTYDKLNIGYPNAWTWRAKISDSDNDVDLDIIAKGSVGAIRIFEGKIIIVTKFDETMFSEIKALIVIEAI